MAQPLDARASLSPPQCSVLLLHSSGTRPQALLLFKPKEQQYLKPRDPKNKPIQTWAELLVYKFKYSVVTVFSRLHHCITTNPTNPPSKLLDLLSHLSPCVTFTWFNSSPSQSPHCPFCKPTCLCVLQFCFTPQSSH